MLLRKYTVEVKNRHGILEEQTLPNQTEEEDIQFYKVKKSIMHGNKSAPILQQSRKKSWIGKKY